MAAKFRQYPCKVIVTEALKLARLFRQAQVGPEHLMLVMLMKNTLCTAAIEAVGLAVNYVRCELGRLQETSEEEVCSPETGSDYDALIALAQQLSGKNDALTDQDMFLAMLHTDDCIAIAMLKEKYGATRDDISRAVECLLEGGTMSQEPECSDEIEVVTETDGAENSSTGSAEVGFLQRFGRDLVGLAGEGKLSPVFGRENEIRRMEAILLRKKKNNPLLLGEAGVGKTAVVEGLALRIAGGVCHPNLAGRKIFDISLTSLVAGTEYRGKFEEHIKGLIEEVRSQDGRVILFIDELHTLMGAGDCVGGMDASNILKPYLARGEISLIGATTIVEYRKYIEHDAALARRFQTLQVDEPSAEQTCVILSAVAPEYERYHGVRITPRAIERVVGLADRYLHDRHFPDKAIDLLDDACVYARFKSSSETAPVVDEAAAEHAAALAAKVPVEKVTLHERKKLASLSERMSHKVIAQDAAVDALARAVIRRRLGLIRGSRPAGVFLFTGPTGVGKTMAARVLAEEIFGDGKNIIQFNMSEFSTRESVTKLIGTAPGYVGFEEGGRLVEALRKNPYSVVLFDEIEKAHPAIADIFLQIFEEGTIADGQGRSADCSNAVFIMTSNLLTAGESGNMKTIGFLSGVIDEVGGDHIRQDKNLREFFKPELMNRIDEIVVFRKLDREALTRICNQALEGIRALLKPQGIGLTVKQAVLDSIVDMAWREDMGARPLLRIIDKDILDTLAGCMVEQDFNPGDILEIFRTGGSMKIRRRAKGCAPAGEKKTHRPPMARR